MGVLLQTLFNDRDEAYEKLFRSERNNEILRLANIILQEHNKNKLVIDSTTDKLINLAINNSNDNEAKSAAIQACKRIYKIYK